VRWDLRRRSSWSVKDRVLGYVRSYSHPYRPHVTDGGDKPELVMTGLSVILARGLASIENVVDMTGQPLEPIIRH
jgi:hypothetical protein